MEFDDYEENKSLDAVEILYPKKFCIQLDTKFLKSGYKISKILDSPYKI